MMNGNKHAYDHALWVVVAVIGLHMLEEFGLDVTTWAGSLVPFRLLASEFYVLNFAYLTFAVASAMVGWRLPAFSLATPATCLVNVGFMHVLGTLLSGRFSPGLLTGVVLFLPASGYAFWAARRDGVLTRRVVLLAFTGGTLLQLFPIVLLYLRQGLGITQPVH
jgi:hypothetical protein